MPVTLVATDPIGQAIGAVGLGQFDPPERRDRSPWALGMVVCPRWRGRGVGRRLLACLDRFTASEGYPCIWVATGGPAVDFYQRCGWQLAGLIGRDSGEEVSILCRSLVGIPDGHTGRQRHRASGR